MTPRRPDGKRRCRRGTGRRRIDVGHANPRPLPCLENPLPDCGMRSFHGHLRCPCLRCAAGRNTHRPANPPPAERAAAPCSTSSESGRHGDDPLGCSEVAPAPGPRFGDDDGHTIVATRPAAQSCGQKPKDRLRTGKRLPALSRAAQGEAAADLKEDTADLRTTALDFRPPDSFTVLWRNWPRLPAPQVAYRKSRTIRASIGNECGSTVLSRSADVRNHRRIRRDYSRALNAMDAPRCNPDVGW